MAAGPLDLSYALRLHVDRDVPLAPYTSLKIGGPADFFVRARSAAELSRCLAEAYRRGLTWLLLGGGSNVLVADRGVRGLVVKVETASGRRNRAEVLEETADSVRLRCEAGALTAGVSRWTAALGFRGLEWACGIPGTIGGATAGNAGAYGGDMASTVERVRVWQPDGDRVFAVNEMAYAYRTSRLKRSPEPGAVIAVDLRLRRGDRDEALAQIEQNETRRRTNQPSERSCGSVFKNPSPLFAGQLIDACGLKGTAHGGAQISERHGNFIVNRGGARASDVVALMHLAKRRVQEEQGITLETEILFTGDWSPVEIAGL